MNEMSVWLEFIGGELFYRADQKTESWIGRSRQIIILSNSGNVN
jgi:hypothetical protein